MQSMKSKSGGRPPFLTCEIMRVSQFWTRCGYLRVRKGACPRSCSSLITVYYAFPLIGERVEVVPFFLQQSIFDELFHCVEHGGASSWIIFAGFKQCVEIERFFAPVFEALQDTIADFLHGGLQRERELLSVLLFHVGDHRAHIRGHRSTPGVEQRSCGWQRAAARITRRRRERFLL